MLRRLRAIRPRPKAGMTEDEAREYGTLPPHGWCPPSRPPLRVALRGAGGTVAASVALPPMLVMWARRVRELPEAEALEELRRIYRRLLRVLGVHLKVIGKLADEGAGRVLMWNQESHLDHLVLPIAIPITFRSLYNIELSNVPLYGEFLKRSGNYLVNRHDEAQWRESVAQAAEDIGERGISILVSPEGTRSWDGELLGFKRGGFILAIAAQAPIVPITVVGGYQRLPRTAAIVRPGNVVVVLGDPIETRGTTESDMPALQERLAHVFRETKARHLPEVS